MTEPRKPEHVRLLIRGYFDLLGGGDVSQASSILAPDFVFRHPPLTPSEGWQTRDEFLELVLAPTRAGFPDMRFSIKDLLVEGERGAARWVMEATHLGPYMGVAPTGREVHVTGMNFFQVRTGVIVETWVNRDTLGLLQQIGASGRLYRLQ